MTSILTFVSYNYGNRLQNYALTRALQGLGCKDVRTVRIGSSNHFRNRFWYLLGRWKAELLSLKSDEGKRTKLFLDFTKRHIPTVQLSPDEILSVEDVFVVGSDQCWNPDWGMGARIDGLQCLYGVPASRKLSYAASFGLSLSSFDKDSRERYGTWLKTFDYLGVREDEGVEIVEALSGKEATWVLDPTMLLTADHWKQVERKPSGLDFEPGAFVVKYFLGNDTASRKLEEFALDTGMGIVPLGGNAANVGPAEFVWLIHNAAAVYTDSFHASVFGLLFHKPFLTVKRDDAKRDMSSRFASLAKFPGYSGRYGKAQDFDFASIPPIDWDVFEASLAELRTRSLEWLKSALEGCS